MEVYFPNPLVGNYDKMTDQKTDMRGHREVTLLILILRIIEKDWNINGKLRQGAIGAQ